MLSKQPFSRVACEIQQPDLLIALGLALPYDGGTRERLFCVDGGVSDCELRSGLARALDKMREG